MMCIKDMSHRGTNIYICDRFHANIRYLCLHQIIQYTDNVSIYIFTDIISASEEIGLHLLRNQYQHVYKESPEESEPSGGRGVSMGNGGKLWQW